MPVALPVPTDREVLLGVERSLGGKRWEARLADSRAGLVLAQRASLPEILGRVLAARGVTPETVDGFLAPRLRDLLPDPAQLKDMDTAVARLGRALADGETVAVFGDYDVDGATSAALLTRFFRAVGADLKVHIPDRIAEGYGPNAPALKRLQAEGASLVITVDCGTTAFDALAAAKESGLAVIVVDHHATEAHLPEAVAVINPNRFDETGSLGHLAAVGVTFLLVVALNRALREAGWYKKPGRREPDLRRWLDLVALGTVCDVVPLTGLNRAFVAQGLKVLGERGNAGIAALADVAGVDERPGTYHVAYLIGPRVNAGGRVGEAPLGARLLASDDPTETRDLAARLDGYNAERRAIEAQVLDQALMQIEAEGGRGDGLVFAAGEGWHPGVIGIVAARIKERYNLPALVIALEEGVGRGSARSVPGADIGAHVLAAREAGLLINGGGHPMAAGLTVAAQALAELRGFLDARLARQMAAIGYRPALGLDGLLQPGAARFALLHKISQVGPFGVGNAEPRFALPAVRIGHPKVVGESHVRCTLLGADGARLKGIAFNALDSALGEGLLRPGGLPLHVVGKLRADSWAGPEAVQFIIEDAAPVGR